MNELAQLPRGYEQALAASVTSLSDFLSQSLEAPLVIVGSGGSLTAAHFAARLHKAARGWAEVTTPLRLLSQYRTLADARVLILSARGRNPDILAAMEAAIRLEPRGILGLCTATQTPLSAIAADCGYAHVAEYESIVKKDGFLATNSLLLTLVLLARAYAPLNGVGLDPAYDPGTNVGIIDPALHRSALARETFTAVHGDWATAAAVDFESKMSESGIGRVLLADFRNFAHGRHYWLHARQAETTLVSFSHPDGLPIESALLDTVGNIVPQIVISTQFSEATGAIDLAVKNFHLVHALAQGRGVDPGRPVVPSFGRALYNQRSLRKTMSQLSTNQRVVYMRRKGRLTPVQAEVHYNDALKHTLSSLTDARFGGIVFDYDGTLCSPETRFEGISSSVAQHLGTLLDGGVLVGIATGRGKSVRQDLQQKLSIPHWGNVWIGYYNGGVIGTLSDDSMPDLDQQTAEQLASVAQDLELSAELRAVCTWETRPSQITLTVKSGGIAWVRELIGHILLRHANVRLVESTHSLDLIPDSVSKLNVVTRLRAELESRGRPSEILCIGDQGRSPGNDAELLTLATSLSVDIASPLATSGWNLLPVGLRGTDGVLWLFQFISVDEGVLTLRGLADA